MTDNRSKTSGTNEGTGPRILCILDEGAPTYKGESILQNGLTVKTCTYASPLEEGQVVALSNDTACTYEATNGNPVVERAQNGETLVFGEIVSLPKQVVFPSATDADDDTLAERLAGKYYRTALVELHIPGRIVKATIQQDGSTALVPGVATQCIANITQMYTSGNKGYFFDMTPSSAGGTGLIPLTYVAAGTNGYLESARILLTGFVKAITGD